MKTTTFIFITFALISLGCNEKKASNSRFAEEQSHMEYPKEIDSLGLQRLYDEAKWNFYCLYGRDSLYNFDSLGNPMSFGMLNLSYEEIINGIDTTIFFFIFDFFNKDTIGPEETIPDYPQYWSYGMIFIGDSDSIAGYVGYNVNSIIFIDHQDSNDRRAFPLQPDVIKYIKENKDRIHPWFRNEAVKRGIIKETTSQNKTIK